MYHVAQQSGEVSGFEISPHISAAMILEMQADSLIPICLDCTFSTYFPAYTVSSLPAFRQCLLGCRLSLTFVEVHAAKEAVF